MSLLDRVIRRRQLGKQLPLAGDINDIPGPFGITAPPERPRGLMILLRRISLGKDPHDSLRLPQDSPGNLP